MNLLIPPPLVVAIVGITMWGVARSIDAGSIGAGQQVQVAIALLIAGVVLMAAAAAALVVAKTTINPLRPSRASRLVTGSVFRFSRNPIYLGDLLLLAAIAVWLGQFSNIVLLALFVVYIDRFQIRPEERALLMLFGAEYAAYCTKVRRWL